MGIINVSGLRLIWPYWFAFHRAPERSELCWRWKLCCKCISSNTKISAHHHVLLIYFFFSISHQTQRIQKMISTPEMRRALLSQNPTRGLVIPQELLPRWPDLCSLVKVISARQLGRKHYTAWSVYYATQWVALFCTTSHRFHIQASVSSEKVRKEQEEEQKDDHYGYSQPGPERTW